VAVVSDRRTEHGANELDAINMKFSMAEFWGMLTLLICTFAGIRWLFSLPEALVAVLVLSVPIRAIVDDLVKRMELGNPKGRRFP
jgi:hypothetical protein